MLNPYNRHGAHHKTTNIIVSTFRMLLDLEGGGGTSASQDVGRGRKRGRMTG